MTRSATRNANECHTLNFFFDDDNGCALTVFTNGVRFHIIADAERLESKSKSGNVVADEYKKLITAVRDEFEQEADPEKYIQRKEAEAAELHRSDDTANDSQNSQDSGHGVSDGEETSTNDDDRDSAVDVTDQSEDVKEIGLRHSGVVIGHQYAPEAEKTLQQWMLSPFGEIFKELAPASKAPKNPTLTEWYRGPAYFYNLEIDGDRLQAVQEETVPELEERLEDLIPRMPLPKYLKDLDIPRVQAEQITVLQEGSEPEPYHPIRVKVDGQTQFLKMVDMTSYEPTKREIKLLKYAEKKGLHEKIHIPRVLGLVYEKTKSEIMGFLQTDIEEPTPLTKMLDSDVVEENREKWARETKRIMRILHDNKIIWGDAKADNFMVDKHNNLWIIDFGGSYTEGWVDPDLVETKEGDEMGTQKIVNALEDPDANTFNPGDEADRNDDKKENASRKRSREHDDDDGDDERATPSKIRKR